MKYKGITLWLYICCALRHMKVCLKSHVNWIRLVILFSLHCVPILSLQCYFARIIVSRTRVLTMQTCTWHLLTSNFPFSPLPFFSQLSIHPACVSSKNILCFTQQGTLAALHILISGLRCFCKINACCLNYYYKTVACKSFKRHVYVSLWL